MITYKNKRRKNRTNNKLNHTGMKMSKVYMRIIAAIVAVVLGVSLISCEKNNVEPEVPIITTPVEPEIEIKVTAMFYPITGDTTFISDDTPIEHYLDDTATPLRLERVFTSADIDNDWERVKREIDVTINYGFYEYIINGGYYGQTFYAVVALDGTEHVEGTKPDSEWIDKIFRRLWRSHITKTYIYNMGFKMAGLDQKPSQIYYKAEDLYRYNESELVHRFYPYKQ